MVCKSKSSIKMATRKCNVKENSKSMKESYKETKITQKPAGKQKMIGSGMKRVIKKEIAKNVKSETATVDNQIVKGESKAPKTNTKKTTRAENKATPKANVVSEKKLIPKNSKEAPVSSKVRVIKKIEKKTSSKAISKKSLQPTTKSSTKLTGKINPKTSPKTGKISSRLTRKETKKTDACKSPARSLPVSKRKITPPNKKSKQSNKRS